ncbi:MAG: protein phosphatase CheZ, partial [Gammaproteobacteria bacterium]
AHRTIGSVEALLPMVERISGGAEKLIEDWSRIEWEGLDSTNLSALRDRVIEVVGQLRGDSRALHERLCEILVAQDYQDLTGQVIQRVVQLLQEVEVKLATMASLSGGIPRQARPQGDEAEPERSDEQPQARPRVLTSQGEVDELLAALGR